jgi:uncharacterized membrane-anchored protein YitT (DUF2179 family)
MQSKTWFDTGKRLTLIVIASVLYAFNLNTFVHAGELIPGGFTGLALLIQESCLRFGGFHVPFSVITYIFNAVPAVICFKVIGKRFTIYSCIMVVLSGLLTDFMPSMFIEFIKLHDNLLSSIFGGMLNAFAIALCLFADATSGGTDFIAVAISEKYRKDAWGYIFAGNCVILAVAAAIYTLDKALYSIIFQFTTTIALSYMYRGYQQNTLLIITGKPEEVCNLIYERTHHGVTSIKGMGLYRKVERVLLYSVVSATEVNSLMSEIKKLDPDSFTNAIKTEAINGNFYIRPKD